MNIPVIITNERLPVITYEREFPVRKIINRSNKAVEALKLPVFINLNARSIYNKKEEFTTLVNELGIQLICMSETWERVNLPLQEFLQLDNFKIISNVHQRSNSGGRSAIFASEENFSVRNLNDMVQVPMHVEAVWALLTPNNVTSLSPIKKIVVGAIYSKPRSKKKSILLVPI